LKPHELERKLGLRFKDRKLLDRALVHPSYLNELRAPSKPGDSYERLEFLGDSVVGAVIAGELYRKCPDLDEGDLTKIRSSLVRGSTLAKVARKLDLGAYLKLGKGEASSGGTDRESNLAACMEALIGAVFLDHGFDTAKKVVLKTMADDLEAALSVGVTEDPKSRLQEIIQGKGGVPPFYRTVESSGPDHAKNFEIEVVMEDQVMGRGRGKRKLEAENEAAQEALRRLNVSPVH